MKKLVLLIALLLLTTSCEKLILTEHGKEIQKIELEERKLEYLEKLYRVKRDLEIRQAIKTIDSLELEFLKKY